MAETVARRGGLVVLPQDIPLDVVQTVVNFVKSRHTVFETPITMPGDGTVGEALSLIHKRAHGAVIVMDDDGRPAGIFTEHDAAGFDRFSQLHTSMSRDLISLQSSQSAEEMFNQMTELRITFAPVIDSAGRLVGCVTRKGALRSTIYQPALDEQGRLMIGVAVGINSEPAKRAKALAAMGVDVLVVDTAHGHQERMLQAVTQVRSAVGTLPVVAGNVVTAAGTRQLIEAGADIIKVGVGPGAMCTTRMMTGVGRPQFSAVLECSAESARLGKHIWADGGVRYPRDVALGLAAGASNVMFGSLLAGTYESAADTLRARSETALDRARKELFEEGISTSRMYLDPERPSVEDIIDQIVAGVRSSCTYAGARSIPEFADRAVVGIQSASGYEEGRARDTSW